MAVKDIWRLLSEVDRRGIIVVETSGIKTAEINILPLVPILFINPNSANLERALLHELDHLENNDHNRQEPGWAIEDFAKGRSALWSRGAGR